MHPTERETRIHGSHTHTQQTQTHTPIHVYMYMYTIYSVIIIEYIIPLVEMMGRLDWWWSAGQNGCDVISDRTDLSGPLSAQPRNPNKIKPRNVFSFPSIFLYKRKREEREREKKQNNKTSVAWCHLSEWIWYGICLEFEIISKMCPYAKKNVACDASTN